MKPMALSFSSSRPWVTESRAAFKSTDMMSLGSLLVLEDPEHSLQFRSVFREHVLSHIIWAIRILQTLRTWVGHPIQRFAERNR